MDYYKRYPEFVINDIKFQWVINNYDDKPMLIILSDCGNKGCGNPWNIVEDQGIRDKVLSYLPEQNDSVENNKPKITIKYFTNNDVYEDIKDLLGGDCWRVYSLNDQRELQTLYFDDGYDNNGMRDKLLNNPELVKDDFKKGNTLYVIMGGNPFYDYIYKKVPNSDMYVRTQVYYNYKKQIQM